MAEYRYNGLGHRIGTLEDTDLDSDVDGSDLWYYSSYDERWRMVATYRGSDADPKERFVHHQASASGDGGSSYIDLVAFRERDANTAWTSASDGTLEERLYYCQNQHADVVALITSAGAQREMARYSAYGVPFGLPVGDTNSDGDCDQADQNQVRDWALATPPAYDVRGDLDLDGDVDLTDRDTLRDNYKGVTLGRGVLSAAEVRNQRGVAGYVAAGYEPSTYLIRHRQSETTIGQWNGRDPIGYSTGVNLFELIHANPARLLDPFGLASQDDLRLSRWEKVRTGVAASRAYAKSHWAGMRDPNHTGEWDSSYWNGVEHCYASCLTTLAIGWAKAKKFWDDHELEDESNRIKGESASDINDSSTWRVAQIRTVTPKGKTVVHRNRMGFDLIHNSVGRHCGMLIQGLICELPPDPNGPAYGGGSEADRCWECCKRRVKNRWRGKFGPQTG